MVRLTKKRQKIEAVLDNINVFSDKRKAEEAKQLLDRIPPEIKQLYTSPTHQNNEPMK